MVLECRQLVLHYFYRNVCRNNIFLKQLEGELIENCGFREQ